MATITESVRPPERRAVARSEFLDFPRLQALARGLAGDLRPVRLRGSRWRRSNHLRRLDRDARLLSAVYRTVADDVHRAETISPAAEWLLDNFHLIANEVRSVHHDLPAGYYRRLPVVPAPPFNGLTRIEVMATELIRHSDGRLDAERLRGFVQAFQSVSALTIGELWAWPSALKAALIVHVARLAEGIRRTRDENARADEYLAALDRPSAQPRAPLTGDTGVPFVVRVLQRIREYGPHAAAVRADIDAWLADRGLTPEEAIRIEGQREAADQVSMANTITSLRFCGTLDWSRFVEGVSSIEQILQRDPAGVYGRMDFRSRDQYRRAVEALADGTGEGQRRVALESVEFARRITDRPGDVRRSHVGYCLIGPGRTQFEASIQFRPRLRERVRRFALRHATALYLGSIGLLTVAAIVVALAYATAHGANTRTLVIAGLLSLIPASELAIAMVQRALSRLVEARTLPSLDLERGIPENGRTMVVVPTLFTSVEVVEHQLAHLEVQALGNMDPRVHFALLGDFADADSARLPGDEAILAAAQAGVNALNARHPQDHGTRFYVFHRERQWNPKEERWMGWERKRGKLEEFNRVLRGATDTGFQHSVGDLSILPDIRYCITLDSDTRLPRDAAKSLIGIILHPLNQPHVEPSLRRVTEGYGILQPRVSVTMSSAAGSLFARVYAGHTGVDPYTTAVSDTYQDLFGEGIFAGKGLYHVDAFRTTLHGRVPENALLSHDLFEGLHARAALVTNVEVVDDYPSTVLAHARRQRRWVRGDWQILLWLFPYVPTTRGIERNRLPLISRWKILDNLRRSLVPPALLALLVGGWTGLPGRPVVWTAGALAVIGAPVLLTLARLLTFPRLRQPIGVFLRRLVDDLKTAFAQAVLGVVLLAYHAWEMMHAIILTLVRLGITQRRLLEWETAASVAARIAGVTGRSGVLTFIAEMVSSQLVALVSFAVVVTFVPHSLAVALPFVGLWLVAPVVAYWLSLPVAPRAWILSARDRRRLRQLARKTWHYFEVFAGPQDHWLPPDNFQDTAVGGGLARRTSPTNVGMSLLSTLAAHDLGFIGTAELVTRLEGALDTITNLERHEGHLLNWYDTNTLAPLWPRYVSTVDSGNVAAALIALEAGLERIAAQGQSRDVLLDGLLDTADMVGAPAMGAVRADPLQSSVTLVARHVREHLSVPDRAVLPESFLDDQVRALDDLLAGCAAPGGPEVTPGSEPGTEWSARLLRDALLRLSDGTAIDWSDRLRGLARRSRTLAGEMHFGFLYDRTRQLFAIGYRLADADGPGRLDGSYYDLLSSEARLASFVAIAVGDVPQQHWFRLGRLAVSVDGVPTLLSWSATMFEYLMPSLLMRSFPGTLLDQTCRQAVRRQIRYGRQHGVPWGISESAFNVVDRHGTYQYKAFGIPGLGLKRGLADDLVVAPYATALALHVDVKASLENLERLTEAGGRVAWATTTPSTTHPARRTSLIVASSRRRCPAASWYGPTWRTIRAWCWWRSPMRCSTM